MWNENPCKVNDVEKALQKLRNSIENVQLCKVILGIRKDIYEKYRKLFNSNLPSNSRYLDLDSIRFSQNEELEQQLNRTLNKVNCKKRRCSCAALNIQGIKDKYHELGNHLKVEILASHHNKVYGMWRFVRNTCVSLYGTAKEKKEAIRMPHVYCYQRQVQNR